MGGPHLDGSPALDEDRSQISISSNSKPNAELVVAATENMATSTSSTHTPAPVVSAPSASHTPNPDDIPQSHPMTASNSASSHQSASKDAAAQAQAAGGYGTRSRNKPGISRINYAEDVEMDFEQSAAAAAAAAANNGNHDSSLPESPTAASRTSPAAPAAQKRLSSSNNGNGWSPVNVNSSIPGTSTFSANPNLNVPKKRKAAQASTNQGQVVQQQAAQAHSRRANPSVSARETRGSNMFSFERTKAKLQKGSLVADDGTVFSVNDFVYLVCEPPGDPYYLCRIMEFRTKESDDANTPVVSLRVNWFYRPRDVQRFSNDTRLVFATMHSDVCPLTSLRGKCVVSHKADAGDIEEYKKQPDHFYFSQVFDRFMHRWFEVIPTHQVVNVPENVKKALDERWKYIVVEATKVKELTSNAKLCKRCSGYCAANDSVDCAVCKNTYHMNCVRPALLKKPSRGFAWACAPCSRAQERRLEARRTPVIGNNTPDVDDEVVEEEEEEVVPTTNAGSPAAYDDRPATEAEIAHAKMWTMRYLGIHCRVEDALQYDDRAIYPRASSRLGPKHQAVVLPWYGRPVELVKATEVKKKFVRAVGKKDGQKLSKESAAALEAEKIAKANRPKWIQDEPPGYVRRGEDHPNKDPANTARLEFRLPEVGEKSDRGLDDSRAVDEKAVDAYMARTKNVAQHLKVSPSSVDFLDRALYLFTENKFDADLSLKQLKKTDPVGKWPDKPGQMRKDLRDPKLMMSQEDKKRFEEGVSKYGSELRLVRMHVKNLPHADIVRYWYHWKKTEKGKDIWGSFGGRKHAKKLKSDKAETDVAAKMLEEIADEVDDSAFDNGKIEKKSRRLACKFCSTRHSRVWRRAPLISTGPPASGAKKDSSIIALCERCARLWRKYAIQWENMDETMKKLTQVGSKAWKKKLDPELLKEIELSNGVKGSHSDGVETPDADSLSGAEPSKKKARLSLQEPPPEKKKPAPAPPPPPRPPTPPLMPAMPRMRDLPCAVCSGEDTDNDMKLVCRDCRLTVHRKCYGLVELRSANKWSCDMCANDRKESAAIAGSSIDPASYEYNCILCPVHSTQRDLVEAPKISHKKKNDREKEKERLEKEFAQRLGQQYCQQQKDHGRPQLPREALKRTADNNWVHVSCALFNPDVRFSNAKTLESAEGIPIACVSHVHKCTVCQTSNGSTLACHGTSCAKYMHVGCAIQAGYAFGFEIVPVKSSRREPTVTLGKDTGKIQATIWCKEHSAAKAPHLHLLNEKVDDTGLTAIQLFAQNNKQADLTLSGTTRKANQLDDFMNKHALGLDQRRSSTSIPSRARGIKEASVEAGGEQDRRICVTCSIDTTPRWWKLPKPLRPANEDTPMVNGLKSEPPRSRESSMRVESLLSNGVTPHRIDPPEPVPTNGAGPTPQDGIKESVEYECHKCHHRRKHPEIVDDNQMDLDPVVEPADPLPANGIPQPPPSWAPLTSIQVQAPTHGAWPPPAPYSNGPAPVHNSPSAQYRPHPGYAAPDGPYPPPHATPEGAYQSHSIPDGSYSSHPIPEGPYPPRDTVMSGQESPYNAPAPPHNSHPSSHPGYPRGTPLPQGPLPPQAHSGPSYPLPSAGPQLHPVGPPMTNGMGLHSPTMPHPNQPMPRQSESPYPMVQGHPPPSPLPPHPNYATHHHHSPGPPHHGSPVPGMAPGPRHMPPGLPQQQLPPRAAPHGASASPNVRNLIE
ncbi:hypothetical protein BT63DRAFT_474995 [Microthyrium microscopicum]|uniref:BAH-domain-containing protein n=1 Tax=Microthyrium microscopicum TaxID=703497 RepID=A0A6A6UTC0_9PEZI|nr:hypothetical protein BT63DRAFT_474995 [Microthyrium microscopicum]